MRSNHFDVMDFFLAEAKRLNVNGGKGQMAMQQRWLITSLMLLIASGAQAQSGAIPAALIDEAIDVDAAAARIAPAPEGNGALLYVGSRADALSLRDITVRLNDSAPVKYEFNSDESRALQGGARYRTSLAGMKDGSNQLRVDFHMLSPTNKGITVFKHGVLEKTFNGSAASTTLELMLNKGSFVSDASLEMQQSTSPSASAELGAADFMIADKEYFAAASTLTQLLNSGAQFPEAINQRLGICRLALASQAIPLPAATPAQNNSALTTTRLNQALILIQQGKGTTASAELDAMGRTEANDSAAMTLRDQANLVLAYFYLDHNQSSLAIPVFDRIRSPGPFANAGLLGLGWALLAPPDRATDAESTASTGNPRFPTIVTPRLTADILALKRDRAPRVPIANKDQQTALRKAMVPWTELTGRDPTDPAVQEGMLAMAWTMYHFGAYAQAQENYTRAAEQFDKMRHWYDSAAENIRSGGMIASISARDKVQDSGWNHVNATLPPVRSRWWVGDTVQIPSAVDDNFYFEHLLLSDDFAAALQQYRNLAAIDSALRGDAARLSSGDAGDALRGRISAASASLAPALNAQRAQLEAIAIADLKSQKQQIEKYLIEARFALATIYDRPEMVSAK